MISHTSSISSSIGHNKNCALKGKDYELMHYFDDDQSDNEIETDKTRNKFKKEKVSNDFIDDNLYSSFEEQSKDENEDKYFMEDDSVFESNQKVIEMSPDGNFGKVRIYYLILVSFLF